MLDERDLGRMKKNDVLRSCSDSLGRLYERRTQADATEYLS